MLMKWSESKKLKTWQMLKETEPNNGPSSDGLVHPANRGLPFRAAGPRMATVKPLLLPMLLVTMACCRAAPILPEETKDHIGETASVRGLVEQVSFSQKGNAFLNFGGKYPQQVFTGFVPAQNVAAVGGEKLLKSLAGNPVTIMGRIEL